MKDKRKVPRKISWKKEKREDHKKEVKTKDIRGFFVPVVVNEGIRRRTRGNKFPEIVEIDQKS